MKQLIIQEGFSQLTDEPDYKGFGEHLQDAEKAGIPIDRAYLTMLAKKYNTPIPNTSEWENEFSAKKSNS